MKKLTAITNEMVKHRKENPPQHGEELLLDLILDYTDDEELQFSDALTFVIGGFHTTGNGTYSKTLILISSTLDVQD